MVWMKCGARARFSISELVGCSHGCAPIEMERATSNRLVARPILGGQVCGWPAKHKLPGKLRARKNKEHDQERKATKKNNIKEHKHGITTQHQNNNHEFNYSTCFCFQVVFVIELVISFWCICFVFWLMFLFFVFCPCSLFLNLFFVFDVVLCPSSVFCVIVLVYCFWFRLLNMFLCSGCSLCVLCFVFVVSFKFECVFFVICPWPCRGAFLLPHSDHRARLPPSLPWINPPLKWLFIVFVHCSSTCSLCLMLSFVFVVGAVPSVHVLWV